MEFREIAVGDRFALSNGDTYIKTALKAGGCCGSKKHNAKRTDNGQEKTISDFEQVTRVENS